MLFPPQRLLLSESTFLNNSFLPLLSEHQLELLSIATTPESFRLIHEIKPVPGFCGSLSAEDIPPNRRPVREIRPLRHRPLGVNAIDARNVLVADFAQRKETAVSFPLSLTDTSTPDAIRQFQSHIDNEIAGTNDVCICCGLFIPFGACTILTGVYPNFVSAIEAAIIVKDDLGCCARVDAGSYFCKSCYGMVVEKKIPKFGSANCINVSLCQKYPDVLNDLTAVEEVVIARAHPIMSIIKLRPGGSGFPASYHCI